MNFKRVELNKSTIKNYIGRKVQVVLDEYAVSSGRSTYDCIVKFGDPYCEGKNIVYCEEENVESKVWSPFSFEWENWEQIKIYYQKKYSLQSFL